MNNNSTQRVERFHMKHILQGSLIFFSGISSLELVFEYLNFNLDFPIGLVITNDPSIWKDKIPDIFIFPVNKLDADLVINLEKRQKQASKKAIDSIENSQLQANLGDPRAFIVLDFRSSHPPKIVLDRLHILLENRALLNLTVLVLVPNLTSSKNQHVVENLIDYLSHWNPDYLLCSGSAETNPILIESVKQLVSEILHQNQIAVINLKKDCQKCQGKVDWYHQDSDRVKHFRICHPKYWGIKTPII